VNSRAWYSPADIARERGVRLSKVRAWIASGELVAVNVAERTGHGFRPRWRVSAEALATFDRARSSKPTVAPKRNRASRKSAEVVFF
jgi:hypothetical protein